VALVNKKKMPVMLAWIVLAEIELIDRLDSSSLQAREAASGELRKFGMHVVRRLEAVRGDAGPEVAARLDWLVRVVDIDEVLPPTLLERRPEITERIAGGDLNTWTRVFLDSLDWPDLTRLERGALAEFALAYARRTDVESVCSAIVVYNLRSCIPGLVRGLKSFDTAYGCKRALIELEATEALPAVAKLLNLHEALRRQALKVLAALEYRESNPDLARIAAEEPDAIRLLGYQEDAASRQFVQQALRGDLATHAVEALRRAGDRDTLVSLLRHEEFQVRERAASALREVAPETAFHFVVEILRTHQNADDTIERFSYWATPRILDVLRARALRSRIEKDYYCRLVARYGSEEDEDRIRTLLEDREPVVRDKALAAALSLGLMDAIRSLTRDPDPEVRRGAWSALQFDSSDEARSLLRDHLRSGTILREAASSYFLQNEDRARFEALQFTPVGREIACRLGDRSIVTELRTWVEESDDERAFSAAWMLALIGDEASVPSIRKLLNRDSHYAPPFMPLIRLGDASVLFKVFSLVGSIPEPDYFALNRLRSPDVWKKLAGLRMSADWRDTGSGIACRWKDLTGLVLRGLDPDRRYRLHSFSGRRTALDALMELIENSSAILDDTEVCVIAAEDAWPFWKRWIWSRWK
jgi:HEAT repeat protein